MRLTLRTLLAYLDDTLEPGETKAIGQKVAESDAAQELIARIKQVTRRRRLTTPPATGPNSFEPNTVAEYLDNTLPPDQVAEVEKVCLESDVHLAEIAAAHQILTLVLGQPALVPPTARQRMYGLVHGRRSSRARPAAVTANGATAPEGDVHAEEDDTLLLGLPIYRRQAATRWLLPVGAAALLIVLAGALWLALRHPEGGTPVAVVGDTHRAAPQPAPEETRKETPSTAKEVKPITDANVAAATNNAGGTNDAAKPGGASPGGADAAKPAEAKRVVRPEPPSQERREIATSKRVEPSVLVNRVAADTWLTVKPGARVGTNNLLVSLPGYKSDLRLDSGVGLTLWGSVYEFMSAFLESAVILHAPPHDFDADFTLDRGAVLITNWKDKKAEVRIRFQGEVWDVTLEDPETEVGVGLLGRHVLPYGSGEPPRADGFLLLRKGRATVRVTPFVEYDNLEPAREGRRTVPLVIFWDSQGKGAQRPVPAPRDPRLQMLLGVFDPINESDLEKADQDRIRATKAALEGVSARLSGPGKIEAMLVEMLQRGPETRPLNAILAVRCLGALDAVGDLINVLDDPDKDRSVRVEAITTLRHWIGRNAGQEAILYDPKTRSGALTSGGKFTPTEAVTVMELLHTPGQEQLDSPDFWAALIDDLKSDKLAIRELAFFHLRRWVPEWQTTGYDPAGPPEARRTGYDQWKKLIPEGKLPPTRPR